VAKILQPVLKTLEALYRFAGGQNGAPTEMELGLGITPVHDLSRMAEIGAANVVRASAGYWLASNVHTHTVTGGIQKSLNLVSPPVASEGYALNERTEWVWLINCWITADDATDFNHANVLINNIGNDFFVGPSDVAPASTRFLYARFLSILSGLSQTMAGTGNSNMIQPVGPIPILSPQDGIRFESGSDTAGTVVITFNALLWIGKRNTFPPGLA